MCPSTIPTFSTPPAGLTEAEKRTAAERADEKDRAIVEEELQKYIGAGFIEGNDVDSFDIPEYWEVRHLALAALS